MIYGSETSWVLNMEQQQRLERVEMRMVRWMCGVVSLRERKTNDDLRKMMGIESVMDVVKRNH